MCVYLVVVYFLFASCYHSVFPCLLVAFDNYGSDVHMCP